MMEYYSSVVVVVCAHAAAWQPGAGHLAAGALVLLRLRKPSKNLDSQLSAIAGVTLWRAQRCRSITDDDSEDQQARVLSRAGSILGPAGRSADSGRPLSESGQT
jgi:hypothetical protein